MNSRIILSLIALSLLIYGIVAIIVSQKDKNNASKSKALLSTGIISLVLYSALVLYI